MFQSLSQFVTNFLADFVASAEQCSISQHTDFESGSTDSLTFVLGRLSSGMCELRILVE